MIIMPTSRKRRVIRTGWKSFLLDFGLKYIHDFVLKWFNPQPKELAKQSSVRKFGKLIRWYHFDQFWSENISEAYFLSKCKTTIELEIHIRLSYTWLRFHFIQLARGTECYICALIRSCPIIWFPRHLTCQQIGILHNLKYSNSTIKI